MPSSAGVNVSPARSVTKMAMASAGPVVWIIWNCPNAIEPRPTITVAALAVMTAPIRLTVACDAACQSPRLTSSRKREMRKIV